MDQDLQRVLCRQREYMEKTVNGLTARLAKSEEEHNKVYVNIMKVDCKQKLSLEINCLK